LIRAILDVNVLIALMDATHTFHARAHAWWDRHASGGWASCPLTENGVVRIMMNPAYSTSRQFILEEIIEAFFQFASVTNHEFWPDDLTLRDPKTFDLARIHGGRQLTDLYLLALAAKHRGRLVTFDQTISISAVRNASPENLCVL
jgi:toxin-antitoxin system PIN domain toxin